MRGAHGGNMDRRKFILGSAGAPMTADDVTAVVAYLDSHYGKAAPAAP
jgi:hypothetical protein